MQSLNDLWSLVLENIKKVYSDVFVNYWLEDLKLEVLNDTDAVLVNNNDFKCDFIEKRHLPVIKKYLEEMLGYSVRVTILSSENGKPDLTPFIEGKTEPAPKRTDIHDDDSFGNIERAENKPYNEDLLVPASEKFPSYHTEYTFDNFIVGNSNKLAYEACIAICDSLADQFNPLFIYGPSGLGKTHLLYAINNRVLSKNPNAKIIYVKGEDFANQLIENLNRKSPITFRERFREKFRTTDVLLIDDIQFIAGKESTQEEIFHTFNALYEEGKQIILTSDRPPREIKTLEERLTTRFEGGLLADIQPPDYELRMAIIKHKAQKMGMELDQSVLNLLAENLRSNIRQIEGAVKKIAAHSFLNGSKINVDLAMACISDILTGSEPVNITLDRIFDKITKKYNISEEDLKGRKRTREIAKARHICIHIMRKMTDLSLPSIGKIFGRDHSTIISSLDSIESEIKENSLLEIEINELIKEIREKQ